MSRVFVIGGATIDTIIQYEDMERMVFQKHSHNTAYLLLEEGKKIEVTEQVQSTGGGATNTAVSFIKQGFDVGLFCKVGQDPAGDMIIQELAQYGLDTQYIVRAQTAGTSQSFVVPALSGDRTLFAYRGANATLLTEELPLEVLSEYDCVYVTSLSCDSAARLPEIAQYAKEHNCTVAVNPGISQLKLGSGFVAAALPYLDTLILNYEEAQQLMVSLMQSDESHKHPEDENTDIACDGPLFDKAITLQDFSFSLRQFFSKMLKMGPKIVVVTNGAEGVYVATEKQHYFHKAAEGVNVVNTLGAGDAFGSSFVGALQQGHDIEAAIKRGVEVSARVIQQADAKSGLSRLPL